MSCVRNGFLFAAIVTFPALAQAQVTPGQWETTVTITSIDMPGAPPQMAQMMKKRPPTKVTYCVTPEQAAKGPREMLKQNPSCRLTSYSMKAGKVTSEMSCSQDGGTMVARSSGSYTPTSFNVTSTATMTGRMAMKMSSINSGRRIGPCTGKNGVVRP
jgi:hypothetical protein